MPAMTSFLVICHPNDRFMTGSYLLHAMLRRLKKAGHRVRVQRHWDEPAPADLVIPHVDLTTLPPSLVAFLDAYPNVVNRRLIDIRKRRISRYLVTPDDPWTGPVIVKTDLNYGGVVDRRNEADAGDGDQPPDPKSGNPPRQSRQLEHGHYLLYDRIGDVPDHVWRDSNLVVERFYAERRDALYGVRQLMICGNRIATRLQWGTKPVVKGESVVERSIVTTPPPANVVEFARAHGLDFGKVDFTIVDGEAYPFDIARTPTGPALIRDNASVIAFLAKGLVGLARRGSDRSSPPQSTDAMPSTQPERS